MATGDDTCCRRSEGNVVMATMQTNWFLRHWKWALQARLDTVLFVNVTKIHNRCDHSGVLIINPLGSELILVNHIFFTWISLALQKSTSLSQISFNLKCAWVTYSWCHVRCARETRDTWTGIFRRKGRISTLFSTRMLVFEYEEYGNINDTSRPIFLRVLIRPPVPEIWPFVARCPNFTCDAISTEGTMWCARSFRARCAYYSGTICGLTHFLARHSRNIRETFAQEACILRASVARIMRTFIGEWCAHLARKERAPQDVTFGPLCTMNSLNPRFWMVNRTWKGVYCAKKTPHV
jgi:hypothetical protein